MPQTPVSEGLDGNVLLVGMLTGLRDQMDAGFDRLSASILEVRSELAQVRDRLQEIDRAVIALDSVSDDIERLERGLTAANEHISILEKEALAKIGALEEQAVSAKGKVAGVRMTIGALVTAAGLIGTLVGIAMKHYVIEPRAAAPVANIERR